MKITVILVSVFLLGLQSHAKKTQAAADPAKRDLARYEISYTSCKAVAQQFKSETAKLKKQGDLDDDFGMAIADTMFKSCLNNISKNEIDRSTLEHTIKSYCALASSSTPDMNLCQLEMIEFYIKRKK